MISVETASQIVLSQRKNYGTERLPLTQAMGRVLAEDLHTDRDLPPFDRVTMDGIAFRYTDFEAGRRQFRIAATQAAGETPWQSLEPGACIEIMTGAALPPAADTVVRYEDIKLENGMAYLQADTITPGQNIHRQGRDRRAGDEVAKAGQRITPALVGMAASVGKAILTVQKLPSVAIISSGDELVDIGDTPLPYQIRRSNTYTIQAVLQPFGIGADLLHVPDEPEAIRQILGRCLNDYDVILLSGGVSMGKFDYIPAALEALQTPFLFHKVQQRPGKPFGFAVSSSGARVFAFPGNPVSTFLCLHRYFLPWLEASLGLPKPPPLMAVLAAQVRFNPPLQYFLQVKLPPRADGRLMARPVEGNGSGDFANLLEADAFLELPAEKSQFEAGEIYPAWRFKSMF